MTLTRNTSTPEGARFWAAVEKSAACAEAVPSWASAGIYLAEPEDDDLRRACKHCQGTGLVFAYSQREWCDCGYCGGAGRVW